VDWKPWCSKEGKDGESVLSLTPAGESEREEEEWLGSAYNQSIRLTRRKCCGSASEIQKNCNLGMDPDPRTVTGKANQKFLFNLKRN
jgi:hypothetical protein